MAVKNSISCLELAVFDSDEMTADYQALNPDGLSNPCFILRIMNASDEDITISYDGVTDNDYILQSSTLELSFQTNAQPTTNIAKIKAGTIIYAKGTSGTGNIYVTGYYQSQQ